MYIAICDDNVADRKHLERLLSRESDKRAGTPNILYIDSFGRKENLLINPLKYDLFFIDMVSSPSIARELIFELKRLGVTAPIVMYSSKIDYSQDASLPDNIVHQKKPYIPEPIPELLALGDEYMLGIIETILPTVDGIKTPVPVDKIYYITEKNNVTAIELSDHVTITVEEPLLDMYNMLEPYEEFYLLKKNVIINLKYTSLINPISIIMQDYNEFHYGFWKYNEIMEIKEKIDNY